MKPTLLPILALGLLTCSTEAEQPITKGVSDNAPQTTNQTARQPLPGESSGKPLATNSPPSLEEAREKAKAEYEEAMIALNAGRSEAAGKLKRLAESE